MKNAMTRGMMTAAAVALLGVGVGQAQAGSVTVEDEIIGWGQGGNGSYTETMTFDNLETNVTSGGWLQVWACGDFDASYENVQVIANAGTSNAIDLGTWLNNNTGDDRFDHPSNDVGTQYAQMHSGTAYLTQSEIEMMVNGGSLELTFVFSSDVDDLNWCKPQYENEVMGARFHYEYGTTAVPTPAAAGMGLVSLGMMIARRRRNRA
ncbi:hypothetical protein [Poriferisphaera sp. WC338]|uniref:hypothetical protein n=1 Tax=Poriferisphaera sp. WC338 TaxID=3425129 RepID=UPI003D817E3E